MKLPTESQPQSLKDLNRTITMREELHPPGGDEARQRRYAMPYPAARPTKGQLCHPLRPRVVPPKPTHQQRLRRPYSTDDLDSLFATAHFTSLMCMVTLKPTPARMIVDWSPLKEFLNGLNNFLQNCHRKYNFPPSLTVTEFDPVPMSDLGDVCAGFHIGFVQELIPTQRERFCQWFLKRMELATNQGGAFHYGARGGGEGLQTYLSKDRNARCHPPRYVKFQPPWVPDHPRRSLWFAVGFKRRPASEGRIGVRGYPRKRPYSAHGKQPSTTVREIPPALTTHQGCDAIVSSPFGSCIEDDSSFIMHPRFL